MAKDALSQILDGVRMRGTVYFHTHFSPPFGIQVPHYRNVARFHLVIRGQCCVRVENTKNDIRLDTGDLIVIPHGESHIIADAPGRPPTKLDDVLQEAGYSGQGAFYYGSSATSEPCQLLCGHFEFDHDVMHPLLLALPPSIYIPNKESQNSLWLNPVVAYVGSEVMSGRAGSDAIVQRLAEIIFIQVIRTFASIGGAASGCLAVFLDEQLGKALSAVHTAPEKPWTVETMAEQANMSRTVFANRFTKLIGMTPVAYVAQWRMMTARRRLMESELSIGQISDAVGYKSESAFVRAFKRQFGVAPGSLRRL